MMRRVLGGLAVLGVLGWLASPLGAQQGPSKDMVDKAQKVVNDYLASIKGTYGQVIHVAEPALGHCFPSDVAIVVRYRQFPVARQLPEGLNASNIFIVDKDGKLNHIKDQKALGQFFKDRKVSGQTADGAREALAAWLTLAQEFHQDGMFKFEVKKQDFAVATTGNDIKVIGRALVSQGGNGEINTTFLFQDGKLAKFEWSAKIIAGPRPICQATKLLDPDPIVRRMAENDLLYLGDLVKDYLDEQRRQANPDLQRAIDRIWQRIQEQRR